jgi:hypothetical protein
MVRRAEVFDFENNLCTEVLRGVKRARMTAVMAISEASDVFESENRVGFAIEWLSVIEMREERPVWDSRALYIHKRKESRNQQVVDGSLFGVLRSS